MERPQTRRGSADTISFWDQQQLEANNSQIGDNSAVINSSSRPLTRMVIFVIDLLDLLIILRFQFRRMNMECRNQVE